jgi:hypothetical protein
MFGGSCARPDREEVDLSKGRVVLIPEGPQHLARIAWAREMQFRLRMRFAHAPERHQQSCQTRMRLIEGISEEDARRFTSWSSVQGKTIDPDAGREDNWLYSECDLRLSGRLRTPCSDEVRSTDG